jgi:hypothetical protein
VKPLQNHRGAKKKVYPNEELRDAETIEEGLTFGIRGAEEAVEAERRSPARRRRPGSIMADRSRRGVRQQDELNSASASAVAAGMPPSPFFRTFPL